MDIDINELNTAEGVMNAIGKVLEEIETKSNKDNAYQKAIQIIADDTYDPQKIAIELAKNYPDIFVGLVEAKHLAPTWHEIVRPLIREGLKIPAIKEVRALTGWGLKQSKDAVEAYMNGDPELMKQYQASYDYKTANGIKTY